MRLKIKRLVLQGFKSFKDRQTIHFHDKITGIVGPNGCGKSNIVDALFWVMGETSAKHLRGSSMKDVIFSGSSKHAPGSFAEVTLVLDNEEGKHIHIGNKVCSPSEIQLTRKLYRNGESEYRINNTICRLKDIQEVFMDTGAGAKSYSIIAQGEINKLVQAKPVERRTMIEEVAGITKFKFRKRESLRKIEQTTSNLSRLVDIKNEIEKNLNALKKQAEKAERARSLKEKVRRNDLVVQSHKVFEILKELRDGRTIANEKKIELESAELERSSLDQSLTEERIEKDVLTERLNVLQDEYNQISRDLAAKEERFQNNCEKLSASEKAIEEGEKNLEQIDRELEQNTQKIEEIEDQLKTLKEENEDIPDHEGLKEQIEFLQETLEEKKETQKELAEKLKDIESELTRAENESHKNQVRIEDISRQLEDISVEMEELETKTSGVNGTVSRERNAVNELRSELSELSIQIENSKSEIDKEKSALASSQEEVTKWNKAMVSEESTLESLKELRDSHEGVQEGVINFLKEFNEDFQNFSDVIKCDDEFLPAIQTISREFSNCVVRISQENKKPYLQWTRKGEAVEIFEPSGVGILCEEARERLRINFGEDCYFADDVVSINEGLQESLKPIFSRIVIASSVDEEMIEKFKSDLPAFYLVSKSGDMSVRRTAAGAVVTRGNFDAESGIVARNNRIEALEESLIKTREEYESAQKSHEAKKEALAKLELDYEELRERYMSLNADFAGKESSLKAKLEAHEGQTKRLDILKNRKSEFSEEKLNLLEVEENLIEKLETLRDSKSSTEEIKSSHDEELEVISDEFESKSDEYRAMQVAINTYEERLKAAEARCEDFTQLEEKLNTRKSEMLEKKEIALEQRTEIESQISQLEEENKELATVLATKETGLNSSKDQLAELLKGMQEREDRAKKLGQMISKNEKEVSQIEMRAEKLIQDEEQIVRNIFEKYQIDLRRTLGNFLGYESDDYEHLADLESMYFQESDDGKSEISILPYEFNRRYGQDLKDCEVKYRQYKGELSRLGDINWQAIEDYERQKVRYEFLQVQESELKLSLEDLNRAIEHIDEKSKERFKVAFEEVNSRFERVFPIIFGGGSAKLKIIGDLDDPECGVDIIAQPPGKKMQNINLMSGGEKALTAVSLIFSIFLVKPSPFCLLDEVDAPLDDANVGRFNDLLREMSSDSQFILITHNKKTMELNNTLYGVTMQEPGVSKAMSVQLQ